MTTVVLGAGIGGELEAEAEGNKTLAATLLGITRRRLYTLLASYGAGAADG